MVMLVRLTLLKFILVSLYFSNVSSEGSPTPIVIWHGMGDSCCNPLSMGSIKKLFEEEIPKVYVKSIEIGSGIADDTYRGFFDNVNVQVADVCKQLMTDPLLNVTGSYHAIGFSQGSQFLRAVVQRCGHLRGMPRMRSLVSIGGQQQGVFGFPRCPGDHNRLCEEVRRLLDIGAYTDLVQRHLVQAQYWHDPLNEEKYKAKNIFLADINQENVLNETYRNNLLTLEHFVLVKFLKDTMVDPKDSEWFEYYVPGQDVKIQLLNETRLYQQDLLGLKQLNEAGKLHFYSLPTDHLQVSRDWLVTNIVNPFFKL